ncbi:MAG: patatin-like phospholipase family protein [Rikenellaceae bacterium]|jgi:NTE family protein|nr:patatin-like phospholipase family protein [Rikenellaceae bacterium]
MKRVCLSILLLILLVLPRAQAQRIGVVFSGGGAKGLYHIGILKALEENQIPIDYIAGTSMGAIIAGLYAIGYTPQEMADLFLSDQVRLWMSGRIESEYMYYFNRMQPRQDMVTLNLDLRSKTNIAVIPTSLVPSTQIDMAFNEIFAPSTAYSGGDFDRLMVPFRCVASDVFNKRQIVYEGGDIGQAIRASMTIPMVFRPLKADSVLLYDGGIFNNFPWEPLEAEFQPDLFIGGKCVKGLPNPDETNILEQIEAITMMHTDFDLPEGRGILIERVFDDVGILDFGRAQYVMDVGYADAMAMMDSIKARVSRRQPPEELANRRLTYRSELPELVFNDYQVEGLSTDQSGYVRRMLGLDDRQARAFDYQDFKSAYFKILSEGEIIGDYPEMTYSDSTGFFTVNLPLRSKPSFRVKFGGNISSTSLNQAYFGLEYKTIAQSAHTFNFDGNFSGVYTSMRAGWRTDFYLRSPVYIDLRYNYNDYNYRRGSNWSRFSRFGYHGYRDHYLSASFGIPWGWSSAIQFRFNVGENQFEYYDRNNILQQFGTSDQTRFQFYGAQIEATTRTLNYAQFPTRGIAQSVSAIYVNGRESFTPGENFAPTAESVAAGLAWDGITNPFPGQAHRSWLGGHYSRQEYFPLKKWLSLGYHVEAAYTTLPDFYTVHATNFVSPSFMPTPYSQSLYMDQFRSKAFLGLGVMPTLEFAENFYLKNSAYFFLSDQFLDDGLHLKDQMKYILDFSLVYQSPIGPVSLTVTNFEEATRRRSFVVFNFGYTLFNKRGLFY